MSNCCPHERGNTIVGLNKSLHGVKTTQLSPVDQSTQGAVAQDDLECLPCQTLAPQQGAKSIIQPPKKFASQRRSVPMAIKRGPQRLLFTRPGAPLVQTEAAVREQTL